MATFTAQILVGSTHPNHGGLTPSNYVFLSENSRPAWILVPQNIFDDETATLPKVTWIPTVENMLEDALVMIGIHVSANKELVELAKSFRKDIDSDWIEVYSALSESQRTQLYDTCRKISALPKIIVSTFEESSIERQLPVLEEYAMDVEVCPPTYSRLYSPWTNETRVNGSLQ